MTEREALKLALDKKAENARELGLDYEPENTLHWHALNYRTAPTQNAQKMFAALEKFVEDAIKDALAQPEHSATHGEPVAFLTNHRQRMNLQIKPEAFVWMPTTTDWEVPLYTALPQRTWVGLTDEEIFETHKQVDSMQYLTFGKAIENKLKEKNT